MEIVSWEVILIYVFYADVFFCANFLMNGCIFMLVAWLLGGAGQRGKWWRGILAVLTGSLLETGILLGTGEYVLYLLLSHVAVIPIMVLLAFGWRNVRVFFSRVALCYGIAILLGGCAQALENTFSISAVGSGGGIGAAILCFFALRRLCRAVRGKRNAYPVGIRYGEYKGEAMGLLDTGNLLHEPCLNMPVHIISQTLADELHLSEREPLSRLPFSTLSGNDNYVNLYIADNFRICTEGKTIDFPGSIIGVPDSDFFSRKEYDVIINGDLQTQIMDEEGRRQGWQRRRHYIRRGIKS